MKHKIEFHVKASEWKRMTTQTKLALAEMVKLAYEAALRGDLPKKAREVKQDRK